MCLQTRRDRENIYRDKEEESESEVNYDQIRGRVKGNATRRKRRLNLGYI